MSRTQVPGTTRVITTSAQTIRAADALLIARGVRSLGNSVEFQLGRRVKYAKKRAVWLEGAVLLGGPCLCYVGTVVVLEPLCNV